VATDRDTIAKLITPTYVMLMNEDKPTPPPPPPVPKPKVKPETVPKPEIDAPRVSANAIEVTQSNQPPAPVVVEAPAPALPQPKLAAKVEASMICPTQVKPVIPRQALINNIQGLVRVEAVVTGGAVKEVRFLSGPRIFQDAVRSAMLQYKCSVQQDTVLAIQEFNFHFD